MQHSKARTTFRNRILHFNDDLEFMDIIFRAVLNSDVTDGGKIFQNFIPQKHTHIARYTVSQDNRRKIAAHCKAAMYSSYVKDLYEEVSMYLMNILTEAAENTRENPERILGDLSNMSMTYNEILTYAKDGTITQKVIERVFQHLENERSTVKLIDKICKRLGLKIDEKIMNEAVYYLEIRHKLVHTDGFADDDFRASHPSLTYTPDSYIDLTYDTIVSMREKVTALMDAIDSEAISKGILKPHTVPKK